ncbi:MAG: DUF2378 family protein [Archangium sp.]
MGATKMEGVVFRHAVESFLANVVKRNGLLTPDFEAELLSIGFDVNKPRDTDAEVWLALLRKTAKRLEPNAPEADALERVGREMLRGLFDTLVGRGMLMVMKLLGPRKALLQIAESYKTSDNITKVTTQELSPTHVKLSFNSVGGVPTYVRGLLREAMHALKVRDGGITFLERADGGTDFEVKWS